MSVLGSLVKLMGKNAEAQIEKAVSDFLPTGKNLTFLDCGCDSGEKTIERAKIIGTVKVLGVEVVPERARKARANKIKVSSFDLNKKWNLKDSSVDIITATELVEHLVDLDNFFSEAQRVLKKKGKIIISTENLAAYHNIFALLLGNQPYTGPYLSKIYPIGHRPNAKFYKDKVPMNPHLNVMTVKALRQLLKYYGFKVLNERGVYYYPSDLLHSSYIVVLAQK